MQLSAILFAPSHSLATVLLFVSFFYSPFTFQLSNMREREREKRKELVTHPNLPRDIRSSFQFCPFGDLLCGFTWPLFLPFPFLSLLVFLLFLFLCLLLSSSSQFYPLSPWIHFYFHSIYHLLLPLSLFLPSQINTQTLY